MGGQVCEWADDANAVAAAIDNANAPANATASDDASDAAATTTTTTQRRIAVDGRVCECVRE